MKKTDKLIIFQSKKIRRIWHGEQWYFSVVDVVEALTDSPPPRQYWGKVKQREFVDLQLSPIWVQLKLESADGKKYDTDCVNTKDDLRLIQSIPKYINLTDSEKPKYLAKRGDILFNRTNSKELVGKTAVYQSNNLDTNFNALMQQAFKGDLINK